MEGSLRSLNQRRCTLRRSAYLKDILFFDRCERFTKADALLDAAARSQVNDDTQSVNIDIGLDLLIDFISDVFSRKGEGPKRGDVLFKIQQVETFPLAGKVDIECAAVGLPALA